MKSIFKFLVIVFCCINFTACSNDDIIEPTEPEVVVPPTKPEVVVPTAPTIPSSSALKPAVVYVSGGTSNSKSSKTTATKRLVKTITYWANSGIDANYKTNLSTSEYTALPTDNLYDPTEEPLNITTNKFKEKIYSYDANGRLEKITTHHIEKTSSDYQNQPTIQVFSYTESGIKNQATTYQSLGTILVFEYNSSGQIISAKDLQGTLKYAFEYDANNNLSKQDAYTNYTITSEVGGIQVSEIKALPYYRYRYYFDTSRTYRKVLLDVDQNGIEKINTNSVSYEFEPGVSGIYSNEATSKVLSDNTFGFPYLHITKEILNGTDNAKPKYFYDSDGYLRKFDSHGLSKSGNVTLYIYE